MVESLSNNADKSDVDAEVEDHRANEVHDQPQPPEGKGDPGGVAELDDSGAVRGGQIPSLAVSNTFTVTNESDLTGLSSAEIGDVGIVSSQSRSYILTGDYSVQDNWVEFESPPAPVDDVNGQTGSVSLGAADVDAEPSGAVSNHSNSTTDVHGVGQSNVESESGAQSKADTAESNAESYADTQVSNHSGETGGVHGVAAGESVAQDGDPQPPENHGNEAHTESYATAADAIDTRRAVNQLVIANAEQDFELGLNMLEYDDGQYEVFANDNRIRSASDGVDLQLGSPLNNLGYASIGFAVDLSASIAPEQGENGSFANSIVVTDSYGYSGGEGVTQWDPETMDDTGNSFNGHSNEDINKVVVTDSYGYSGSSDNTVQQWNPDTMNGTGSEFNQDAPVNSVFVTDSYGYSGGDALVKQWDPDTMNGTGSEFTGHEDFRSIRSIFVTDSYGYSGSSDNTVKQWDPDTMNGTGSEFTGHTIGVYSVFVTDSYGYSSDFDGVVKQWDPDTMNGTGSEFTGHTDSVYSVFVTDSYGYSGSSDNTVKQWNPDTMNATGNEFTGHTNGINSVFVTDTYGYSGGDVAKKWGEEVTKLNGTIAHVFEDLGFVPEEAVINDDLRQPLPANATVYYKIEDADGNSETILRSEVDTAVDLTGFTSSEVSTTAIIERDDTTVASPQLDAWALYLRGA